LDKVEIDRKSSIRLATFAVSVKETRDK